MADYKIKTYNHYIGYAESLVAARHKAFGYLMDHKSAEIFIHSEKTGDVVGFVYYERKKKDRYGRILGPMYWSDRTRKDYLLDLDGTIFSVKTEKKMPGQSPRKKR